MQNTLFFRNDDVRNKLDDSLIKITDLFVSHKIPIAHAVEPANINTEVVEWLNGVKKEHPDLICIMQHGYDHSIKNKMKKGEFGGQRTYQEQFSDISKGKELMNKWFGDSWFPAFNFPYAPYNPAAMKAVDDCGYLVINSHFNSKFNRKVFYLIGHAMNRGFLFNHHVSWNLNKYPGTNLFEIDMNISFINKYYNEQYDCQMLSLEQMIEETQKYLKYKTIGVLLHHRYHNTDQKIKLVADYLKWCKTNKNFEYKSLEEIYKQYKID